MINLKLDERKTTESGADFFIKGFTTAQYY